MEGPAEECISTPREEPSDKGYMAIHLIHEHDQKMLPLRARAEGLLDKKSNGPCTLSTHKTDPFQESNDTMRSTSLNRSNSQSSVIPSGFCSPYGTYLKKSYRKVQPKRLDYDILKT